MESPAWCGQQVARFLSRACVRSVYADVPPESGLPLKSGCVSLSD